MGEVKIIESNDFRCKACGNLMARNIYEKHGGLSAVVEEDEGEDVELPEELISSGTDVDGEDCDACTI